MMSRNCFIGLMLFCLPIDAQVMLDTIADQRLQEVVVKAKLPLVEMQPGKTVYRMDVSISQSSGNMYDVLSSSRYDAGGGSGLIDIHTKRIKLRGVNLSLNGTYSQWKFGKGFGSAALNIREDKFNVYLSYSYYKGKDINDLQIDRFFTGQQDYMKQVSHRDFMYTSNTYLAGFDYCVTKQTTLGVSLNGNASNNNTGEMNTGFVGEGVRGTTLNAGRRVWNNFSTGVTLMHRLNKKRGEFDASFDYFRNKYTEKQLMHSFLPDTLKGDMGGTINLYTGQANFTYPIGECVKLQTGVKTSFVTIGSNAGYARPSEWGWEQDTSLGSCFSYNENINAAYVQADYEWKHLKLSAGVRLEQTHIRGNGSVK